METFVVAGNGSKQPTGVGVVLISALVLGTLAIACEVPPPTAIAPATEVPGTTVRTDQDAGRELSSGEHGPEEGRVVIRGINRYPSLSLTARNAAANPLVLVDGVLLEGGLGALLVAEPLDISGIGYSADPREFGYFDDDNGRGIVLINQSNGQQE